MPITETVRAIAEARGTRDDTPVTVVLWVDLDPRGKPAFYLRIGEVRLGPYRHEDEAVDDAEARYGAIFD
jgi:hypothetical protein